MTFTPEIHTAFDIAINLYKTDPIVNNHLGEELLKAIFKQLPVNFIDIHLYNKNNDVSKIEFVQNDTRTLWQNIVKIYQTKPEVLNGFLEDSDFVSSPAAQYFQLFCIKHYFADNELIKENQESNTLNAEQKNNIDMKLSSLLSLYASEDFNIVFNKEYCDKINFHIIDNNHETDYESIMIKFNNLMSTEQVGYMGDHNHNPEDL